MSAAVLPARMASADFALRDPGASAALPHTLCGQVQLITAAAETRTQPDPLKAGLEYSIAMRTDGGDCVVTFATAYDDFSSTTMTFNTVGQVAKFVSVRVSDSAFRWKLLSLDPSITSSPAELNILDGVLATAAEINRAADTSTRIVNATASTLTVTELEHDKKTIVLDRAAGIAATLPAAAAGLDFEFIVKTTFTGAASIKSVSGADIMIGHAIMGNDSDNTTVRWPAIAADTFDTIDLLGTGNSTGGMAGQTIRIRGLAANLWHVTIIGDAAGTEATPFQNTVA